MKLLPSENLMLQTPLPKSTVFERLSALLAAEFPNTNDRHFEGKVEKNSFLLRHYVAQNKLFIPEIKGKFTDDGNGTVIQLSMKPTSRISTFVALWFASVVIGFIIIMLAGFFYGGSQTAALIPCAMLGAGIGFLNIGFTTENQKAKKALAMILDCSIIG